MSSTNISKVTYNDGSVEVKKGSGLVKKRKGQTEEMYQDQLKDYRQNGALIQDTNFTINSLNDTTRFCERTKIEKERIMHGLEALYYQKNYQRCLADVTKVMDQIPKDEATINSKANKVLKKTLEELTFIQQRCLDKLQKENTEKLTAI